jgi:eukaryotic-like serine/threonine-protein kinase
VIATEAIQSHAVKQECFDSSSAPHTLLSSVDVDLGSSGKSSTRTLASNWRSTAWNERALVRGQVLAGTYEIGDLLGQGGMGQVFAAVDRTRGCDVAIKTTWARKDRDTLANEARVLAALQHPGIVRFHGLETDGDCTFIVMERLRGSNLQSEMALWDPQARPIDRIVDCLIAVCGTLETIHASGYAHRDLKPQNVVLADGAQPVIIDFGLAVHRDELDGDLRMAGSPHYIAPESIASSVSKDHVHLIDIYALGVLAFEVITGRPPFRHCVLRKILDMHLHERAPRLAQHVASVPEALEQLVAAMMDKNPRNRPQSAREVAERLRAIRVR